MTFGAPLHVAQSDAAGRGVTTGELQRAARYRHLAEVELLTGAAGAGAHHDHADLRPAQPLVVEPLAEARPGGFQLVEPGLREHRQPAPARPVRAVLRSEGHTTELQSLMRTPH